MVFGISFSSSKKQPLSVVPATSDDAIELQRQVQEACDRNLKRVIRYWGLLPADVQHRFQDYKEGRKSWAGNMTMNTARRFTKELLPLIIHIDTRMTDEEKEDIDRMTRQEVLNFVERESSARAIVFLRESSNMSTDAIKDKVKNRLRLNIQEISKLGAKRPGDDGEVKAMAAYWYQVRPESWRPVT